MKKSSLRNSIERRCGRFNIQTSMPGYKTTASLASSEGCRRREWPKRIQRCVALRFITREKKTAPTSYPRTRKIVGYNDGRFRVGGAGNPCASRAAANIPEQARARAGPSRSPGRRPQQETIRRPLQLVPLPPQDDGERSALNHGPRLARRARASH